METKTDAASQQNPDSVKQESPAHTGHTPGLWEVHEGLDYIRVLRGDETTEQGIAVDNIEDARLIAAAPVLLDNLRSIIQSLEIRLTTKGVDQPAWKILNEAREAVALATGKDAR